MVEINGINEIGTSIANSSYKPSGYSTAKDKQVDNTSSSGKEVADKVQLSTSEGSSYAKAYANQLAKEIENISAKIDDFLKDNKRHLNFNVTLDKGLISVEVIEDATGEVVRKVPPDMLARLITTEDIDEIRGILISFL
jgi:uncharacterized FlaG/YvyC family protein